MGTIRSLPEDLVEKIAAGEVVERPASVVKELVENAIDAGARAIRVDVAGGGAERITVIDDGCGMDSADIRASVMRHATSKIASEDDLWNISTMGFRGEALAAVGAVSRLTIESKVNEPEVIEGSRLSVEGGVAGEAVAAGCAGGTRVEVADLFFNVPARRKFLKSAAVEAGHIYDVVSTYALANPSIRFELTVDGAPKLRLPSCAADIGGVGSRERVTAVLGGRAEGAFAIDEAGAELSVVGVVSENGRRGGKDLHIFLNGRPVRDRMLMHAVAQGFGERCRDGAYPAAALWIAIDRSKVDVNVHPAKREVRFQEGGAVYSFIASAIRKPVSEAQVSIAGDAPRAAVDARSGVEFAITRYESGRLGGGAPETPRFVGGDAPEQRRIDEGSGTLAAIGQYALGYVVCEDADGSLVLIDQHAAHERLGFDELLSSYRRGSVPQQRLLIPEQVELGERSAAYISERVEWLQAAGFELEPFGGGTVVVKAVPAIIGGASIAALMESLAAEIEEMGGAPSLDEAVERIFAVVACHGQVRAGDRLSQQELEALVRDVEAKGVRSCPHGRPAMVRIGREEIEKWFRRR